MTTIGLSMIVLDEAGLLDGCLASVHMICDQAFILISGEDGCQPAVEEVCRRYGAEFGYHPFTRFDEQRNISMSHIDTEWVLWLDADDEVPEPLRLREYMDADPPFGCVMMSYQYAHDDMGNCTTRLLRERLVRRSVGWRWKYPIHEVLVRSDGLTVDACNSHLEIRHRRRHAVSQRNEILTDRYMSEHVDDERWLHYAGNTYQGAGRIDEAMDCHRKVLDMEHAWIEHRSLSGIRLAGMLMEAGRLDEALPTIERTREIDPRRIEPWIMLGDLHRVRGDRRATLSCYETAVAMPLDPSVVLPVDPTIPDVARQRLRDSQGMLDAGDTLDIIILGDPLHLLDEIQRLGSLPTRITVVSEDRIDDPRIAFSITDTGEDALVCALLHLREIGIARFVVVLDDTCHLTSERWDATLARALRAQGAGIVEIGSGEDRRASSLRGCMVPSVAIDEMGLPSDPAIWSMEIVRAGGRISCAGVGTCPRPEIVIPAWVQRNLAQRVTVYDDESMAVDLRNTHRSCFFIDSRVPAGRTRFSDGICHVSTPPDDPGFVLRKPNREDSATALFEETVKR